MGELSGSAVKQRRANANRRETLRLVQMVERMRRAGAISDRQHALLQGISATTDPKRILDILSCER